MLDISTYLNLFSPAVREKPRFLTLATAILSQVNDLLTLVQSGYPAGWDLETAVGAQLDGLGVLLNTPRPAYSTPDEDYRFLLRARAAAFHWDGTNEALPEVLEKAFPHQNAALIDHQDGTVSASLDGTAPFPLKDLFPVPAGVRVTES